MLSEQDRMSFSRLGYDTIRQYLEDCKNGIYTIDQFIRWLHKPEGIELCDVAGLNPDYLEYGLKQRVGS